MLRGLTSDAGAVQSPQFFDIPTECERQGAEGTPRGRSRADAKQLPPEPVAFQACLAEKIETARNVPAQVFVSKTLRKHSLRAQLSAAPLKPESLPCFALAERPLRAQLSAAPLKPGFTAVTRTNFPFPPRSIERGPVEAPSARTCSLFWSGPPRSIERGPVEASSANTCSIPATDPPRSIERGPVEAISAPV